MELSTTVEIFCVVWTSVRRVPLQYLQQQKFFVWFGRRLAGLLPRIYNSRNFLCGLDAFILQGNVESTTVEIFCVVWTHNVMSFSSGSTTVEIFCVVWTSLDDYRGAIYNSRNFLCGLDLAPAVAAYLSTTVEIFCVVWTGRSQRRGTYLQQQKFFVWFGQEVESL